MTHPFRFGIQLFELPPDTWRERAQLMERLGFSSIFWPDHFSTHWEPMTAQAAVAAVTDRIRVGSLVYDVDYRHPVIYAKAAATLHLISGGRHEFGIGAGWMEEEYLAAGIPFDRAGVRIARLDEALEIICSMWTQKRTTFSGEHYQVDGLKRAAKLPKGERPYILVGGGGPKILALAGRRADIVGINPMIPEGRVNQQTLRDLRPDGVREKIGWVREAAAKAGRSEAAIEFNSLVFGVVINDEPQATREGLAKSTGMTPDEVADCPLFLTGSSSEICDRLQKRREETGISYITIQAGRIENLEQIAEEIIAPLNGK